MHSLSEKGRYSSHAARIWILCVINAGKLRNRTSPLAQWWNRVISKCSAGMNISRVTARETWLSFANSETLWSNSCQNIWHECHRNRYRWSVRRFDFSTFFDLYSQPRVDCTSTILSKLRYVYFYDWQLVHCSVLKTILGVFSNFYTSGVCARVTSN